ncbi:hypothetical protein MVES1_000332 [Malassezia vespertilionis]|uniref:uncharacterized protein n=1 Tax=Malassezia vespertilionis TaxID=2020962 RepID=UPI0024B1B009|nr:uncharacterized protein MVES1_000332 [Malassezia vespertilionis]WFD05007.1 hypothetical protein MVES1_000332 [Malassezia vespertilionis]
MANRGRAAPGSNSEELQVWQAVRTQLKVLDNARNTALTGYERLSRARAEGTKSLEGLYNVVESTILDEQRAIEGSLEQLDILLALRQAPANEVADGRRRKRRAEESAESEPDPGMSHMDTKHKSTTELRKTRASGPLPKRGALEELQKGRKVAFCQPQNSSVGMDEGEVWIMATIIGCINNDYNRYVVQDAEEEGTHGPTWNTTTKSIVPLPNSIESLPHEDYAQGTRVLALYPDTSCFYNATVRGGGPHLQWQATKIKKREQDALTAPYQLMFDDDGADIKHVPAYLVPHRFSMESKHTFVLPEFPVISSRELMMDTESAALASAAPSGLTWQQEMMTKSFHTAPRHQEKRAGQPKQPATQKQNIKKCDTVDSTPVAAMTWQQQMLRQGARRGPTFDHPADARDAQTFGGANKKAAAGTMERRKGKNGAKNSASDGKNGAKGNAYDAKMPATPRKGAMPDIAYAGPTFHNSPSAASLPAPRFSSKPTKLATNDEAAEDAMLADTQAQTPSEPAPVSSAQEPVTDAANLVAQNPTTEPKLQTVDNLLANMMNASFPTSSLLYLEEPGSVALLPAETTSPAPHVRWDIPGRSERPGIHVLPTAKSVQVFPNTQPHPPAWANRIPVHDLALHGISFLHRYHPGIDIPSRLLAESVLEDAQWQIAQEDHGDNLTRCTTTMLHCEDVLLVVCAGGIHHEALYISTWTPGQASPEFHASSIPAFEADAPIVSVQSIPGELKLLIRTLAETYIGSVRNEAPYSVHVDASVRTGTHVPAQVADATYSHDSVIIVDTHGTVQQWDVEAQRRHTLVSMDVEHDAFWALAVTSPYTLALASCYAINTIDRRTPAPTPIVDLSHSVHTMCRNKITSLQPSFLHTERYLLALASTDAVQYYDVRFPNVPMASWAHDRGYDRTLTLCPTTPGSFLLASQKNRLLGAYSACIIPEAQTWAYLAAERPCWVQSAIPEAHSTPLSAPFAANLQPHVPATVLLEQSERGALWMRYLDVESALPAVHWSPATEHLASEAHKTQDPGPFGDAEVTRTDWRTLYKAAILGWLGISDPFSHERAAEIMLQALQHAPATSMPHTLLDSIQSGTDAYSKAAVHLSIPYTLPARSVLQAPLDAQWRALLEQCKQNAPHMLLHISMPWLAGAIPTSPNACYDWFAAQQHTASAGQGMESVRDAERQQALDVFMASMLFGTPSTSSGTARNTNWRSDSHVPCYPAAPSMRILQRDGVDTQLSDAARLLLAEWPLDASPDAYMYETPYHAAPHEEHKGMHVASSQAPSTARGSVLPRVVSKANREPDPARSPIRTAPASQDASQERIIEVQTQKEPGRFAQRPATRAEPKRRKRMGGF